MMIKIIVGALVMMTSFVACRSSSPSTQQILRPARINHLAFFKLRDPADAAELISDCDDKLSKIPGVCSYYAGQHLDTGRGGRVDSNYDVGFYVGFVNEKQHEAYVSHPDHLALVEKWRPRWEWIRIHDVLDETP
jgi:hypothetical protein